VKANSLQRIGVSKKPYMPKKNACILRAGLDPLWVDEDRFWHNVTEGWAVVVSHQPLTARLLDRRQSQAQPADSSDTPATISLGDMLANVGITGRHRQEPDTPASAGRVRAAQAKIRHWPHIGDQNATRVCSNVRLSRESA
jgi:hypothetical protein